MAIKVVQFDVMIPYAEKSDCIVLRMFGKDANAIEMAFPFHPDTPNFILSIPEALDLRNAIDELIDLKMLEKPKGVK